MVPHYVKRTDKKSDCPVNFTLEAVGDPWSLLVLRDIVYFGKHAFKEFLSSEEKISSNILTDRLGKLLQNGILSKVPDPANKRSEKYILTQKGLDLIPVLLQMMEWGTMYDPESTGHRKKAFVARIREEESSISREVREKVRSGKTAFS